MSAMDVDKALDDIIATRPRNSKRRGGPRPAGAPRGGARAVSGRPVAPIARTPAGARGPRSLQTTATPMGGVPAQAGKDQLAMAAVKIITSNLPMDVEEGAIRELFVTTVGPVRETSLSYDSKGKSKGVATIIFKNRGDAQKAYEMYNNRMIDQKRPLKVEVVLDPSKVPLAARVAPMAPAARPAAAQVARGAVSRRGKAAAPKPKRAVRPKKTAEDLDQEMADYAAANTTAA